MLIDNNEITGLKISEMITGNAVTDNDILPVVQDSFNKKVTFEKLTEMLAIPRLSSDLNETSTSIASSINASHQLLILLNQAVNEYQTAINQLNASITAIENEISNISVDWSNILNKPSDEELRGPQGIQGVQGLTGPQGLQGPIGQPGPAGIDGANGVDGKDGIDGTATYFHVKYSVNADGNPMTNTPSKYIGTVVTNFITPPTNYAVYTWYEWKGAQGTNGEQGIPGTNGSDGQTSYLHIKYGIGYNSEDVMIFTANNGEDPGPWVGMYTDHELMDSSDPNVYTWSYVKGEQGEHGQDGDTFEYIFRLTNAFTRPDTPETSQEDDYVPVDWTDDPTDVTAISPYMWCSKREKSNGVWSEFSEPALWAKYGKDGEDGQDGEPGVAGPVPVYLGVYDSATTYIGNPSIINIVKWNNGINDFYYMTKVTTGEITNVLPSNTLYWEIFQGQYESIATKVLFAEEANIGGWIFHTETNGDEVLKSQNNKTILNGTSGTINASNGAFKVFENGNIGIAAYWTDRKSILIHDPDDDFDGTPANYYAGLYKYSQLSTDSLSIFGTQNDYATGYRTKSQFFSSGFNIAGCDNDTGSGSPSYLAYAQIAIDPISREHLNCILKGLPTTNPGITGAVWNDSGTLKIV